MKAPHDITIPDPDGIGGILVAAKDSEVPAEYEHLVVETKHVAGPAPRKRAAKVKDAD